VLRPLLERKGEGHREVAARARAGCGGVVAERPEEEDEGVGPMRQSGRGRGMGWAELAGRPRSKGSGGSRPAEGQDPGGWAENLSWAQFKK
jgi:hypothetical protein